MIDKPLPPPKCFQNPFSSPAHTNTHRSSTPRTVNNAEMRAYTSLQVKFNHHHWSNRIEVTYHFSNSEPIVTRVSIGHNVERGVKNTISSLPACQTCFFGRHLGEGQGSTYMRTRGDAVWCEGAGPWHAATTVMQNWRQKRPLRPITSPTSLAVADWYYSRHHFGTRPFFEGSSPIRRLPSDSMHGAQYLCSHYHGSREDRCTHYQSVSDDPTDRKSSG